MKNILGAGVLFALSWTICIFAATDSTIYRPDKSYLKVGDIVESNDGKIYVFDGFGWFVVDKIQRDDLGVFYLHPKD